jgi:hypothetical protein
MHMGGASLHCIAVSRHEELQSTQWRKATFLHIAATGRHGVLAEAVRFELTDGCPSPVFKFTVELN